MVVHEVPNGHHLAVRAFGVVRHSDARFQILFPVQSFQSEGVGHVDSVGHAVRLEVMECDPVHDDDAGHMVHGAEVGDFSVFAFDPRIELASFEEGVFGDVFLSCRYACSRWATVGRMWPM